MTLEHISCIANRVVDFGPPLVYPEICKAYSVEKMSLWQHTTDDLFEMVVLRASQMPQARMEGTLYSLSDEEVHHLDKQRGVGVNCERKRIPFYLPFPDDEGRMSRLPAYTYIGIKEYWVDRISFGSNFRLNGDRTFHLAQRHMDDDRLLNGRFCFLPSTSRIVVPGVSCVKEADLPRKLSRMRSLRKWNNFTKRFKAFVNDF